MKLLIGNRCLLCDGEIVSEFTWRSIFTQEKQIRLCKQCLEKFERISGETCDICGRSFALLDAEYRSGELCLDCRRWEEDENWRGSLDQNRSLYSYSSFKKEFIARFKFRGDYVLAEIFAKDMLRALQAFQYDYIVPVPLSDERLYERGFNQSEAIIRAAGLKPTHLLSRLHTEKQSKKSKSERIHLDQVFRVDSVHDLRGKKILIVDDIYTTGSTLRHAARLLKGNGADKVYSLTLAR
jgi:competence protein ComFC